MSEKEVAMKELTQAVIVLEKQPATVTVVIHGYMDGDRFVMRHTEVDSSFTEVVFGELGLQNELLRKLGSVGGLTAFTDDEVKVESVLLQDGKVIEIWKYVPDFTAAEIAMAAPHDDNEDKGELSIEEEAKSLLALLGRLGLASATVQYSGSGDSGDAEYVEWTPVDGGTDEKAKEYKQIVTRPTSHFDEALGGWVAGSEETSIDLEQLLLNFTNRVVEHYHSGYENNDGGSGNIHFDTIAGTVELHHEDYYTESSCTDTELFVAGKKGDDDAPSGS